MKNATVIGLLRMPAGSAHSTFEDYVANVIHGGNGSCAYVAAGDVRRTSKGFAYDEALIESLTVFVEGK